MSLDLYAGTLTRFYTEDWESLGLSLGPDEDLEAQQVSPGEDEDEHDGEDDETPATPEEVREAVESWRAALSEALETYLSEPLEWDESPEKPYFTDQPGWEAYAALLLWAAHAEHPELERPTEIPEQGWAEDPAYLAAIESDSGTAYRQILQPELWLPGDFPFCFEAPSPIQQPTFMGSTQDLERDLEALNEATFKATPDELTAFLTAEAIEAEDELEAAARYGLAVFLTLAKNANEHRLPLMLAY
ncbi:MAG TPA: hypothetical protein VKK31_12990 [Thermoanaerobaculia bacterium]|nr:hypothetical protein [Thermoanaerobaculia bacterium]